MEKRRIGRLEVSLAGLGCNNFGARCDEEQTAAVVRAALDEGVTFFDTADIYGGTRSEEFLGRILAPHRDEVVIATKFGMQVGDDPKQRGGSARWIRRAVEASLQRLQTDRIDLYQFHAPDPKVPIEETLAALDALVAAGKVLEIGNSNFSGGQILEADSVAATKGAARFVSAQNHYNLLRREAERDVLPACEANDLAFLPYFPLASGLLTGKYRRGEPPPGGTRLASAPEERRAQVLTEENFAAIDRVHDVAAERGRSLAATAIAWLCAKPVVASVISGATRPEQVRANARATSIVLDASEVALLDRASAR